MRVGGAPQWVGPACSLSTGFRKQLSVKAPPTSPLHQKVRKLSQSKPCPLNSPAPSCMSAPCLTAERTSALTTCFNNRLDLFSFVALKKSKIKTILNKVKYTTSNILKTNRYEKKDSFYLIVIVRKYKHDFLTADADNQCFAASDSNIYSSSSPQFVISFA